MPAAPAAATPRAWPHSPPFSILVPDPGYGEYADRWPGLFARYAEVLAAVGVRAVARPWTHGCDASADLHLANLAWGYHLDEARWRDVLAAWPDGSTLLNPPALLAWNTRKTYLAELESLDVAVIPTHFAERGDAAALAAARARFGEGELVIKPQTSAGALSTLRLAPGEGAEIDAPVMIQPFLPAVAGEGELSLFLFGGAPAHAVAKVAAPGEFRVQSQHGGRFTTIDAPADAWALARCAIAAAPARPAYARVDMVRDAKGVLRLMELELIEPDLFLEHAADGGAAFARAVLAGI